jgi:hypothetical protein
MRRTLYKAAFGAAGLVFVLLLVRNFTSIVAAGVSYAAQRADTSRSIDRSDTTRAKGFETRIGGENGEGVRIRINEEGISIEGSDFKLGDADEDKQYKLYQKRGTDIVKFGEDVFVHQDEMIRGDLVVFGGDVEVEGVVGGNVVVIGGDIDVRSGAEIRGDAVVLGGKLDEDTGAIIQGERVSFNSFFPFRIRPVLTNVHSRMLDLIFVPVKFFLSLILAVLLILFLGRRVRTSEQQLEDNVLKCFGIGFLTVFVGGFTLAVLTILLCITIIGIPLAFLLIVSSFGVVVLAWTIAAYGLGTAIRRKSHFQSANDYLIVLIGMLVLFLPGFVGHGLSMIPFLSPLGLMFRIIGFFITIFAEFAGLGALFLSRFGGRELVTTPPAIPSMTPGTS